MIKGFRKTIQTNKRLSPVNFNSEGYFSGNLVEQGPQSQRASENKHAMQQTIKVGDVQHKSLIKDFEKNIMSIFNMKEANESFKFLKQANKDI